jgi:FAD/FMN-containing dehydrogenase
MPGTVIQATNLKQLSNLHGTFRHPIENLFNIANGNTGRIVPDYNATTKALQQFLGEAANKNKTLRCLGSNWSWTPVGYANDWILHTKRLNILKRILPEETDPSYFFEPDRVVFSQCGCTIQELSRELRRLNRSLKTSGASNGQTIAGATATGTHGSAIDVGATPDFVVGIHLIVSPNRHVYLERASYPVVSLLFVQKIDAELVRDDDLFNAALVSFGSFGIIHGMMLETEPLYLLQTYRLRLELDQVAPLAETLDFDAHPLLPFGGERPFHFQFLVNPHDLHNGVYVSAMYKRPYREDYPRIVRDFSKAGPGEDAPAFLGRLTHSLPVVTALVVNNLIKNAYAPYNDQWGTLNEIFSNTDTQGRVLSAAVGIPAEKVNEVNNLLLDLTTARVHLLGFMHIVL